MKIDLKENPDELNYISREFPENYIYSGENESLNAFKIFIRQSTLKEIDDYLSGDLQNELGGVVLGDICVNSNGQKFIFIDNLIIAKHSNSSLSRLTFTHDTWDYINGIQEEDYPDKKILGWFHSHPGHTVFLSNYDMFIQENFFNMEYMVAYVFDPTIKERGFFCWKEGKILKADGYYITNVSEDNFVNELLPESLVEDSDQDILKPYTKPKIRFYNNKTEFKGTVLITLLFLALLVLLFMIYNIYEIRQKALLKDEYMKDLAEIRNENKLLSERLNNLISENNLANGNVSGQKVNTKEISEIKKDVIETKPEDTEKKPDISELKKDIPVQEEKKAVEKSAESNKTESNSNSSEVTVYKVKSGDTLEKISNQFYKSRAGIEIIMKQNNIKDKAEIKIGQQLLIPVSLQN